MSHLPVAARRARRAKSLRIAEIATVANQVDASPAVWLRAEYPVPDYAYVQDDTEAVIAEAQSRTVWARHAECHPADDCRSVLVALDMAMERAVARRGMKAEPIKVRARYLAQRAIAKGELVPQPCERCGAAKAEAHHVDYAHPLDVRWLCRTCHADEHRGERHGEKRIPLRQAT